MLTGNIVHNSDIVSIHLYINMYNKYKSTIIIYNLLIKITK